MSLNSVRHIYGFAHLLFDLIALLFCLQDMTT